MKVGVALGGRPFFPPPLPLPHPRPPDRPAARPAPPNPPRGAREGGGDLRGRIGRLGPFARLAAGKPGPAAHGHATSPPGPRPPPSNTGERRPPPLSTPG